jgi:hypothetical protein
LLVRKFNRATNTCGTNVAGTAIAGFHDPWPATRHDRETQLTQTSGNGSRRDVRRFMFINSS